MFGSWFNNDQLRRFLIAFGSLFTNMEIHRSDANGVETQRLTVPLDYAPKERWLARLEQDPTLQKGVGITVPRMSYIMTAIAYDQSRKLNTLNNLRFPSATQRALARLYVGVPYLLSLDLSILTKTQEDGLQLLEQILPYFTPDLTFRLVTLPDLGVVDQIPLTLAGVHESDNYDADWMMRRMIVWTLTFTMPVNFYGIVKSQGRIEEVIVDMYNSTLDNILVPTIIATETWDVFTLEDDTGHLMDESTSNAYLTTGRVARIDVVATNPEQDIDTVPISSVTTVTESDTGDLRRDSTTGIDELI
jgi:hypothetical protein